ncbi:MAG TPA: CDP-alcohol phosphatidyltransferase family protein [Streptosporangiaceae bacterium]
MTQRKPGQAEPGQAQPGRAEPGRAEPGRAEPGRAEPGRAEPGQVQPRRAQPEQAQPGRASSAEASAAQADRVLTIPNLISIARLAGVPVFLWLVLGVRSPAGDWWAVGILIAAGASDWLDGKIARALNQQSRLGELLDPAADRLYIVSTIIALAVRSIIGWWLVLILAAREVLLGSVLLVLRRHDYGPLRVSFVGKAATLSLLYAFPLLFLGSHQTSYAVVARVAGWAFALWGTALYWWAAVLYLQQARRLLATDRDERVAARHSDGDTARH